MFSYFTYRSLYINMFTFAVAPEKKTQTDSKPSKYLTTVTDRYFAMVVLKRITLPMWCMCWYINTLGRWQNGRQFAIFNGIVSNETFWISIKNSLNYVPYGLIVNMAVLVMIMAWHRTGDKPLSEAILVCCVDAHMLHADRTQWVKHFDKRSEYIMEYWCKISMLLAYRRLQIEYESSNPWVLSPVA